MSEKHISDYLAYLVAHAHRKLHGQLERSLQAESVSVEQWRMLEILSDGEGRSMGEIADLALMNHPALTKMTDRMVARGLVHRAPDDSDQRRVLVFLTDRGAETVKRVRAHVESHNAEIEEHLGPRETARLRKLLDSVISHDIASE